MFVYHIDRANSMSINQVLSLENGFDLNDIFNIYNNSLSIHGIHYLSQNPYNDIPSFLWEFAAEYVRILKYPQYPSRFQCLFAVENLEQLDAWKTFFEKSNFQIVKLECSKIYKFDANWITKPGSFKNYLKNNKFDNVSFASYCYFADKYWSGQPSPSPLWELLVPLPCKCVDIL
jgi:hypothetical protein